VRNERLLEGSKKGSWYSARQRFFVFDPPHDLLTLDGRQDCILERQDREIETGTEMERVSECNEQIIKPRQSSFLRFDARMTETVKTRLK
jgi:hypothetical protein